MQFTKTPCVIGGQTADQDWLIKWGGHDIGRVHMRSINNERSFNWSTGTYPAGSGNEPSENLALAALKAFIERLPFPVKMAGKQPDITGPKAQAIES
jgi:hypothetical protein